jgi:hypothetical protein
MILKTGTSLELNTYLETEHIVHQVITSGKLSYIFSFAVA